MNLFLGIAALVVGPLLYHLCQRWALSRSALDGLLFITIAGIVIVHIVPDALEVVGASAFLFLLLGVGFALVVERLSAAGAPGRYGWVIVVGVIGLAIHAAVDGLALLPGTNVHDLGHAHESGLAHELESLLSNHLALGVILHRIAVGAAIWWTLRPLVGPAVAIGALLTIAVATIVAYQFGPPVMALLHTNGVALFQAFVAGTLLHIIVLTHIRLPISGAESEQRFQVVGERLGIVAGLILLFLVPHAH